MQGPLNDSKQFRSLTAGVVHVRGEVFPDHEWVQVTGPPEDLPEILQAAGRQSIVHVRDLLGLP